MEVHIETPFPAAKPSAFTTIGALFFLMKIDASSKLSKTPKFAVGMLFFLHNYFMNAFEPSNCDANLFGPNTLTFFSIK